MTNHIAPYEPLPWQVAPIRDTSRILVLTGAAGGGKSRAVAEKMHMYCQKYAGATGIALRKAREFAAKSVVFALKTAIGNDPRVHYNKADLIFQYDNGSKIFIAGMKDDTQREALRSINGDGSADIIWCEEANAFTEDDHNELSARLRGKAASWRQICYSTNPDSPNHWIKRRLIDGGEGSVYYSKAEDNPHNPPDYLEILATLTGVLGKRLRDGLWVQAEGQVYDTFDPAVHEIDPIEIRDSWTKFRAIDFGYTNPFCCQWWAITHDNDLVMYREIYMTGRTVKRHSVDINKWSKDERIAYTVCDHDAEDRATLHENGIPTIGARKSIAPGLQAVEERLKIGRNGKPRIYFVKNCTVELDTSIDKAPISTVGEFTSYIWPKGVNGKSLKETPLDLYNHGMDTMRYAVMSVDKGTVKVPDQMDLSLLKQSNWTL